MRKRKTLIVTVGCCMLIFFFIIAYWTVLPRTGTIDIPGEGVYTGQLRGMTFHGYGTYISYEVEGNSYEGQWKNGLFHGQGTLTFANGYGITGEFRDGDPTGTVVLLFPDGHTREAEVGECQDPDHHSDCSHDH